MPGERQVRGLYGAQVWEREAAPTETFLTTALGFERIGSENGWTRYGFKDAAGVIDIKETPDQRRGAWGVGAVHHLAWRVDDEAQELAVRAQVEQAGGHATPVIDRFWFKSVYFKEPGGVLFELATDGPGFAIDEKQETLGETLVLPPFLESQRAQIEKVLPPLTLPAAAERARRQAASRGVTMAEGLDFIHVYQPATTRGCADDVAAARDGRRRTRSVGAGTGAVARRRRAEPAWAGARARHAAVLPPARRGRVRPRRSRGSAPTTSPTS